MGTLTIKDDGVLGHVTYPADNRAAGKRARSRKAYLVPALPKEAPYKAQARRKLRPMGLGEYLRQGQVWGMNLRWKYRVVPVVEMTASQIRNELAKLDKRLSRSQRSVRDKDGYWYTERK